MKYKYNGNGNIIVSSKGKVIMLKSGDEVEFDENDIKYQQLNNFVLVEERRKTKTKKKKKKNTESEE